MWWFGFLLAAECVGLAFVLIGVAQAHSKLNVARKARRRALKEAEMTVAEFQMPTAAEWLEAQQNAMNQQTSQQQAAQNVGWQQAIAVGSGNSMGGVSGGIVTITASAGVVSGWTAFPVGEQIAPLSAALRRMIGYVERPETLTIEVIDAERNTEVRRMLIERFGFERFIREGKAEVIDHDERWGTLYRRAVLGDEPIMMVEVINRSPEPDGSFRRYMLRVGPHCRPMLPEGVLGLPQNPTALNAIASTFGMTGADYAAQMAFES